MDIVKFALKNKLVIYLITILSVAYGFITYEKMGKLQDPEFTIKTAVILTQYPGANAQEVELEVSDKIEDALQTLPYVKEIETKSSAGLSYISVTMKNEYRKDDLAQIWDEMRRKVNDITPYLPPRASTPIVNDDFGDVYGITYAISGQEYSYEELKDYVDFLKKELVLLRDVGKVTTFGEQTRAIIIEFDNTRLAKLGISKNQILQELYLRNLISDYGKVNIANEYVSIRADKNIDGIKDLSNIVITGLRSDSQILLKDVADIKETYKEPVSSMLRYDGQRAIAIGISTRRGGNVVKMGEAIEQRLQELEPYKPLGINVDNISNQADDVVKAIDTFMLNLIEALIIVIGVLLIFMGVRSGLIIAVSLLITIIGTFIFMYMFGVYIERVSLGALIIALGMLVDNSIVIVDGILVRVNKGMDRVEAASQIVKQTALPLLAATTVAILAFAIIGTSDDMTGEYTSSLFYVVLISLGLSWIVAITLVPLLSINYLKSVQKVDLKDRYNSFVYRIYGSTLQFSLNHRYLIVFIAIVVFLSSLYNMQHVKQNFFPDLDRKQVLIDFEFPQGTSIDTTKDNVVQIEEYVKELDGVEHISSFIGSGFLRFLLIYGPHSTDNAYAQILLDIDNHERAEEFIKQIEQYVKANYPEINVYGSKFVMGASSGKLKVKIYGDDLNKLREYEEKVAQILKDDPKAKAVRSDWGNRVKVIKPVILDEKASLNGITRDDIANAILDRFEGRTVGVYREDKELIPIIFRDEKSQRDDIKQIENIQILSAVTNKMIPLRQLILSYETVFEDEIIYRFNRKRAITISAEPVLGALTTELFDDVKDQIEAIPFEDGYYVEWHGEHKLSKDAKKPIIDAVPIFVITMVLIIVALFNSIKRTVIIWLTLPFASIGVVYGLIIMDKPFGFMAFLGFMSLFGMLIKNAIVLIDEIVLESSDPNKNISEAIYHSGLNRLRPVTMAALTTALGMIPLLLDPFFSSMATVIVFGLMVATILTMVFLPVLYSIFFKSEKIEV